MILPYAIGVFIYLLNLVDSSSNSIFSNNTFFLHTKTVGMLYTVDFVQHHTNNESVCTCTHCRCGVCRYGYRKIVHGIPVWNPNIELCT